MNTEYAKVLTDMVVVKYAEELALDQENVSRLAESIEELGLLNPITVVKDPDNYLGQSYTMVAGRHRLAAVQKLGWDEVDAIILDCEPTDTRTRRLAEIAENLHRKELTRLERSKLVAEWVELVGGEKVAQVAPLSGGRGIEGGDRKAARDLGLTRDDVRRSKKVAGLTDEAVEAAKELGLDDNQTALLKAAREKTAEAQVAALEGHVVKSERKASTDFFKGMSEEEIYITSASCHFIVMHEALEKLSPDNPKRIKFLEGVLMWAKAHIEEVADA